MSMCKDKGAETKNYIVNFCKFYLKIGFREDTKYYIISVYKYIINL